jgi:hypothetical protein
MPEHKTAIRLAVVLHAHDDLDHARPCTSVPWPPARSAWSPVTPTRCKTDTGRSDWGDTTGRQDRAIRLGSAVLCAWAMGSKTSSSVHRSDGARRWTRSVVARPIPGPRDGRAAG